jgi:hypothetical protein
MSMSSWIDLDLDTYWTYLKTSRSSLVPPTAAAYLMAQLYQSVPFL